MRVSQLLHDPGRRAALRDELIHLHDRRSSMGGGWFRRLRITWKLHSCNLVVGATKWLKRFLDVAISAAALVALSPLFLIVAAMIKWRDLGPILFWQKRVGRWGKEFDFP